MADENCKETPRSVLGFEQSEPFLRVSKTHDWGTPSVWKREFLIQSQLCFLLAVEEAAKSF